MEEDIKIVKEIKKEFITKMKKDITHNDNQIRYRNIQALQNILNELDRLKNENEELREQVNMFDEAYSGAIKESKKWFDIAHDSIPKSKIENKIETYRRVVDDSNDGDLIHDLITEIHILEELLGND